MEWMLSQSLLHQRMSSEHVYLGSRHCRRRPGLNRFFISECLPRGTQRLPPLPNQEVSIASSSANVFRDYYGNGTRPESFKESQSLLHQRMSSEPGCKSIVVSDAKVSIASSSANVFRGE